MSSVQPFSLCVCVSVYVCAILAVPLHIHYFCSSVGVGYSPGPLEHYTHTHTLFHLQGRECALIWAPSACTTAALSLLLQYILPFSNLFICPVMNMFESASDELLPPQWRRREDWRDSECALHCTAIPQLKNGAESAAGSTQLQLWCSSTHTCSNPSSSSLSAFSFQCFLCFLVCQKYCDLFFCELQVADSHFRTGACLMACFDCFHSFQWQNLLLCQCQCVYFKI